MVALHHTNSTKTKPLAVAFLPILSIIVKSSPDRKADFSESISQTNQLTQCCPTIKEKFGKNSLLIIAMINQVAFWVQDRNKAN